MNDNSTTMLIDDSDVNAAPAPAEKPAEKERTAFKLFAVDLPWPGPGESRFAADMPQPAIFQRVYRAEKRNKAKNKVEPVMRLVWLAAAKGTPRRHELVLQGLEDLVLLADDASDPELLGVVSGARGEPFCVWQLMIRDIPADEKPAAPEATQGAEPPAPASSPTETA